MRRFIRLDWLLVIAQVIVVLRLLGTPDINAGLRFFTAGYPTGAAVAALITCLIWLVALSTVAFVVIADVRAAIRGVAQSPATLVLVAAFSCVCFASGWMRYQQATFHGCCGTVAQAQAALEGTK